MGIGSCPVEKPNITQPCRGLQCSWSPDTFRPWTDCSNRSGNGQRNRQAACECGANAEDCDNDCSETIPRPNETEVCFSRDGLGSHLKDGEEEFCQQCTS